MHVEEVFTHFYQKVPIQQFFFFFLTHFHVKFGLLISTKKIHDLKLYYSIICMYTVELEVKSHSLYVAESDLFVQIKNGNNN